MSAPTNEHLDPFRPGPDVDRTDLRARHATAEVAGTHSTSADPTVHLDALRVGPGGAPAGWAPNTARLGVQPAGPAIGVAATDDGSVPGRAGRSGPRSEPRTIRVRVAAAIAVVTFLVGLGVAMLLGPIMGPGPGGPGGPGGAGTSTSQQGGTQNSGTQSGTQSGGTATGT